MDDLAKQPVATPHTTEQLLGISQKLWSEISLKGLIKRFARILVEDFGILACGFVQAVAEGKGLSVGRQKLKVPGVTALSGAQYEALLLVLSRLDLMSRDLRDGVFSVDVDGQVLFGCLAAESDEQSAFVFWQSAAVPSSALEFIARQLQSECRWFQKLSSTQALLYKDDLTDLYNHRYFELTLESELRRAERFHNSFCLLFIDLDNFKSVNDQHGHPSGSLCLKQAGGVIRDAVREIDVAIRYGGDEFIVVLLGATATSGLLAGERVRRAIEDYDFRLETGERTKLTASIGVAAYPEHGLNKAKLLKMADETMYRSKRAGKNRVTIVKVKEKQLEGHHAGKITRD